MELLSHHNVFNHTAACVEQITNNGARGFCHSNICIIKKTQHDNINCFITMSKTLMAAVHKQRGFNVGTTFILEGIARIC